jgi:hypothetical protein
MKGLGEEDSLAGFSGRRDDGLSGGLEPFVQADPNSRVAGLTDWSREQDGVQSLTLVTASSAACRHSIVWMADAPGLAAVDCWLATSPRVSFCWLRAAQ